MIGNGGDGMPIYPVKNYKTGETKELNLTIANYEKWREENPDWDKNWQGGVARVGKYPRRALISDALCAETRAMDVVPELETDRTMKKLEEKDMGFAYDNPQGAKAH